MPEDLEDFTYRGGFAKLVISDADGRFAPYPGMAEVLADLAAPGLDALAETIVAAPANVPEKLRSATEKRLGLEREFAGQSALLVLHALCITASRRADPPPLAQALFLALWREKAPFLLKHLTMRWKISALQSFETFGTEEVQRISAAELSVFFQLVKLYESERFYSGLAAEQPFDIANRARARLPFDMSLYSLKRGDLDRNLLGRLWTRAEGDPLLRPLACHLLLAVNRSPNILFRRLKRMREALRRRAEAREDGNG